MRVCAPARASTGSEPVFQSVARQLTEAGIDFETPFHIGKVPEFGLSEREVYKRTEDLAYALTSAEAALARGDIAFVVEELEALLGDAARAAGSPPPVAITATCRLTPASAGNRS